MEHKKVKAMLERYYAGSSSLQEEEQLREYLTDNQDIPNELKDAQAIFMHFKSAREIRYPGRKNHRVLPKATRWLAIAASLAVILGTSLLALKWVTGTFTGNLFSNAITVIHDGPSVKKVTLPDNNVVWLNKHSQLIYPRKYTKQTLTLSISGEAYFELLHNNTSDYQIVAENALVAPKSGSSFNIHAGADKESIEVSVSSGAVAVSEKRDNEGLALLVTEGNYCSIHKYQKLVFSSANKNENYLSWKTGTLVFNNTHMSTVTDALAAYYDVKFAFDDKALAYCRFSGEFREKSLNYILSRIRSDLKFDISNVGNFITLSGEGCLPK